MEYVNSSYTKTLVCYKTCPPTYISINYKCDCSVGYEDNGTMCKSNYSLIHNFYLQ